MCMEVLMKAPGGVLSELSIEHPGLSPVSKR